MKYCPQCKVKVDTDKNYCPLCYNELTGGGEPAEKLFEKRGKLSNYRKTTSFLMRFFFLVSIAAIMIVALVDYLLNGIGWSFGSLTAVSILYIWILVAHTILSKRSSFEKVILQLFGILAVLFVCDRVSGGGDWLLYYVIPSVSMMTVLVLNFILLMSRNAGANTLSFFIIHLLLIVVGIVLIVKSDGNIILALFNVCVCILGAVGILLFGFQNLKNEFSKKFHL